VSLEFGLYKILFYFEVFVHESISSVSFYCPLSPALPALLQNYCMSIAQYTTPLRSALCIPYTIQYWSCQYRINAKLESAVWREVFGDSILRGLRVESVFAYLLWRSHRNTNSVFRLVCPVYDLNTHVFKVNVLTKQAKK